MIKKIKIKRIKDAVGHQQRSSRALARHGRRQEYSLCLFPALTHSARRQFRKDEAAGSLHMCERVRHKAGGHRGPLPAAP